LRDSPGGLSRYLSAVGSPACIHVAALDLVRTRLAVSMPPTSFDAARAGGEVAAMTAGALSAAMPSSVVPDDARSPHPLLTRHDAARREEHDVAHARAAELPAPAAPRVPAAQ